MKQLAWFEFRNQLFSRKTLLCSLALFFVLCFFVYKQSSVLPSSSIEPWQVEVPDYLQNFMLYQEELLAKIENQTEENKELLRKHLQLSTRMNIVLFNKDYQTYTQSYYELVTLEQEMLAKGLIEKDPVLLENQVLYLEKLVEMDQPPVNSYIIDPFFYQGILHSLTFFTGILYLLMISGSFSNRDGFSHLYHYLPLSNGKRFFSELIARVGVVSIFFIFSYILVLISGLTLKSTYPISGIIADQYYQVGTPLSRSITGGLIFFAILLLYLFYSLFLERIIASAPVRIFLLYIPVYLMNQKTGFYENEFSFSNILDPRYYYQYFASFNRVQFILFFIICSSIFLFISFLIDKKRKEY